jgi:RNA-directed DNA polymerase
MGLPCVVDRLIQQALLQQLTPMFDPLSRTKVTTSVRAEALGQSIETAGSHVIAVTVGACNSIWKFFGRVNDDVLMAHVAQ